MDFLPELELQTSNLKAHHPVIVFTDLFVQWDPLVLLLPHQLPSSAKIEGKEEDSKLLPETTSTSTQPSHQASGKLLAPIGRKTRTALKAAQPYQPLNHSGVTNPPTHPILVPNTPTVSQPSTSSNQLSSEPTSKPTSTIRD